MTVKELIEELRNYPEDYIVTLVASYDDGYGSTNSVLEKVIGDKDIVFLISDQE